MSERQEHRATRFLIAFTAFALIWFSVWTLLVNASVLAQAHFPVLPWCLLATTIISLGIARIWLPKLVADYRFDPRSEVSASTSIWKTVALLIIAGAGALAAHVTSSSAVLIVATIMTSCVAYASTSSSPPGDEEPVRAVTRDFIVLCLVLLCLYYFGNKPDGDDANYLNMAAKAPLTHGYIFQYDTMVGDGPHPIHLPTYRLQTYELLGGTLAFLTGLEPIVIFHILLPILTIALLACVLALVLIPAVGRRWFAASLIGLGFLYADSGTFTSWGLNGLARFQQGKGPLVVIVPLLAAGLTVHWFKCRQWWDVIGLALLNVCAIGLSANGIYLAPVASAFVTLAFFLANPRLNWAATWRLAPTLTYPAVMAAIVLIDHLGLPSEVTRPQLGFASLRAVVGWHAEGLGLLALMPMLPIVAKQPSTRLASAIYFPAVFLLALNPIGWKLASVATGNLGFRFFWCIPGVFIAGAVSVSLVEQLGLAFAAWIPRTIGALVLVAGVLWNEFTAGPDQRIHWEEPDLRVPRADYDAAEQLSAETPVGCEALVPTRYASWMSGLAHGPYLVAVSSLYLTHYRFSEPPDELAARWELFNLINGNRTDAGTALFARGEKNGNVYWPDRVRRRESEP
jgi:hypothetical protein